MSPLCEICQRDEVIAGRKLCAVCGEAIVRLANAIILVPSRPSEKPPAPRAATAQNAKECEEVLFSAWR